MNFVKTSALAACMMAATAVSAQKVKLKEGDLSALKGTTKLNVQYDYSSFTVGKNKPEAEYIEEKKAEYNKKEPGKGNTWEKSWVRDREARFEPQFKEQFEETSNISIGNNPSEKYTLIFKTTHVEPGYNIGISRKNAEIDGEAWIVETANPDKVVAKLTVDNCPGRTFGGYDFDSGERIKEAYAVAGKGLGKFLKKKV